MNVEGAYQHILTDLIAFIVTAIAGAVILITGFRQADGIASLVVAAVVLHAAYGLLKASGRVVPRSRATRCRSCGDWPRTGAAPAVTEVHDLRVWEITSGFSALSAHVLVGRENDCHATRRHLETVLHDQFGIGHTTLQVDHEGGELLDIELPEQRERTAR